MKAFTRLGVTLGLALLAGTSTARADAPDLGSANTNALIAQSEEITITFLYSLALADNDLYLFADGPGNPGVFLIAVEGNVPLPGVGVPASVTIDITDYGLAIGDELIFGICTTNLGGDPDGCDDPRTAFYSGDATRNPDGEGHASLNTAAFWNGLGFGNTAECDGICVIGFENRTADDNPPTDRDYNDLVFAIQGVSTIPEPATMGLLAIGLVGLSGAGLIRRRNKKS